MGKNSQKINIAKQKLAQENVLVNTKNKVKSIRFVGYKDVYNMEVEEHHNYSVEGGYIIHNCVDATRYAMTLDMRKPRFSFD